MVNFNEVATPKMAERALLLLAQDLEPRGFELRWLLAEYLSLTDQSAEVDGEIPRIHCNVQRIEQVLLNLVNNAAQALFNRRQDEPSFSPARRSPSRAGSSTPAPRRTSSPRSR